MNEIVFYCVIGFVAIAAIVGLVTFLIKFFKLPKDEKKEIIIALLMGFITQAEEDWSDFENKGKEKLIQVAQDFADKAPIMVKLFFKFSDEKDLGVYIEEALRRVKENFGKDK